MLCIIFMYIFNMRRNVSRRGTFISESFFIVLCSSAMNITMNLILFIFNPLNSSRTFKTLFFFLLQ